MPTTKQPETQSISEPGKPEIINEPLKKEVMGIERDDKNARVSFTSDGGLVIITIPIGHMSRALAHGFIYELHDMVNEWFAERRKHQIITRDNINKFSFKSEVRKLFGK